MIFKKDTKNEKKLNGDEAVVNNNSAGNELILEEGEEGDINANKKLRELRERLKNCEKEKSEYLSGWQRSKADFINSKKELATEKESFVSFAESSLIKDILPVLSSFSAAMADKKRWEEVPLNWRQGVEYIYSQLMKVLENRGLEIKESINEFFDPNLHEAVGEEEVADLEKDHRITKVLSPVFLQKGKVIQPAKVIVGYFPKNKE
ncbi:MAG: nucleotide exchange factor GrpE [Patescibacteria group bacterium]